jgi:transcriptional regulator with XRE-family HTH domain
MSIGERLAILLKEKGITQKAFSNKINYREQSISNIITGQTKSPKADLIMEIARLFPDLNLRWLLLEDGEMLKANFTASEEIEQEVEGLRKENSQLKDKIISLFENK